MSAIIFMVPQRICGGVAEFHAVSARSTISSLLLWAKSVANRLIKAKRDGTLDGSIILVGHSNGVLACCKIAEKLSHNGIKVAYIGAIDPTAARFPKVEHNVARVDEFWATSGYPKLKRTMTGNRHAVCQFEPGWSGSHHVRTLTATHIGIA